MRVFKIFLAVSLFACLVIALIACNSGGGTVVGETETIIVEVTDTNGEVVTDDEGNTVTEIVIVPAETTTEENEEKVEDGSKKFNIIDADTSGIWGSLIRP